MDKEPSPCPTCGGPRVWYVGKSQRHSRCHPCLAAKAIAAYRKNPKASNARSAAWRAANRDRHLELLRKWRAENHAYKAATNHRYYVENRETEIARSLAYTKAHPEVDSAIKQRRNARKRAVVCEHGIGCVTSAFLKVIRTSECLYCGNPATEADHYYPLGRSGLHCKDNIVPACKSCNASKNANDPEEWLRGRTG